MAEIDFSEPGLNAFQSLPPGVQYRVAERIDAVRVDPDGELVSDYGHPGHYVVVETGRGPYVVLAIRNPGIARDLPTEYVQITGVGPAEEFLVGPD